MESRPQSSRRLSIILSLIIIALIFTACYIGYRILFIQAPTKKSLPEAIDVTVIHPIVTSWQTPYTTFGTIHSDHGVHLSAESDGRIIKIVHHKPGLVHQGDLLFQIFNESATGSLASQQAKLAYYQRNESRKRQLYHQGVISKDEYQQALLLYHTALGEVKHAKGNLALTNIYAPISGYIGIIDSNEGDYVSKGQKLTLLTPLNDLYVQFSIPAFYVPTVHIGDHIHYQTSSSTDMNQTAQIKEIDNQASTETRQVHIKAYLSNHNHTLIPGDYASVRVNVGKKQNVFVIPDTAIRYALQGPSVFKVVGGHAKQIAIHVSQRRNTLVGITSPHIQSTDSIISDGIINVSNGSPVKMQLNTHESD